MAGEPCNENVVSIRASIFGNSYHVPVKSPSSPRWRLIRSAAWNYGDALQNPQFLKPRRPVAVKRLRRSFASLRPFG